ncbi:hypothetical protein, partial [uncultured Helicobacter sp.]|uniref:hypothetical protein n=1 Tax=uncultured Helicobacter sp. TaxID=175537 RepID=UPI00374EE77D
MHDMRNNPISFGEGIIIKKSNVKPKFSKILKRSANSDGNTTTPPNIPFKRLHAPCIFSALKNIQAILTKL